MDHLLGRKLKSKKKSKLKSETEGDLVDWSASLPVYLNRAFSYLLLWANALDDDGATQRERGQTAGQVKP